jgi:16S rRNA processing protein RimM
MIDLTDCTAIGTIIKAHGIKGQVVLRLDPFQVDEVKSLEPVFIEIDGLPVPFFIDEYTEKDAHTFIVGFEDINSEEKTEEIINSRVFVPLKNLKKIPVYTDKYNDLAGCEVRDSIHGKLGILTEIINDPNNPLFRIQNKKREILIPIQPAFIQEIDCSKKIIYVNTPDGLLEI